MRTDTGEPPLVEPVVGGGRNPGFTTFVLGLNVALALVGFVLIGSARSDVESGFVFGCAILLGQMSLLLLWLVFGRGDLLLRLAAAAAGSAIVCFAAVLASHEVFVIIFLAPIPFVGIPSLIARWRWVSMVHEDDAPPRKPPQFSLARLLIWMVILGVPLAVWRLLDAWLTARLAEVFMPYFPNLVASIHVGCICGCVAMGSLWASLARGRPLVRLLAGMPLVAGIGLLGGLSLQIHRAGYQWRADRAEVLIFIEIAAGSAVVILGTLLLLRAAGYRVAVHEPGNNEKLSPRVG